MSLIVCVHTEPVCLVFFWGLANFYLFHTDCAAMYGHNHLLTAQAFSLSQ